MGELDHTRVSIRFSGMGVNPKELGEMLIFSGSDDVSASVKTQKSGRVTWSISLKSPDKLPLEDKVFSLLSHFTKDVELWTKIPSEIDMDIICGLFLEAWNQGFILSPGLMKELHARNLKISFDIYSPTDSW